MKNYNNVVNIHIYMNITKLCNFYITLFIHYISPSRCLAVTMMIITLIIVVEYMCKSVS